MDNIKHYLFNTAFWISRFITISVFGTSFFAVLNAKYVWSETFFPVIVNIFFSTVGNFISTFYLFHEGCSNLSYFGLFTNNIEKICLLLIINIILYFHN